MIDRTHDLALATQARLLGIADESRRNLGDVAWDVYDEIDSTPGDEFRWPVVGGPSEQRGHRDGCDEHERSLRRATAPATPPFRIERSFGRANFNGNSSRTPRQ